MMEGPSHKDFSVYDFNAGDEAVESASRELLMKYGVCLETLIPQNFQLGDE